MASSVAGRRRKRTTPGVSPGGNLRMFAESPSSVTKDTIGLNRYHPDDSIGGAGKADFKNGNSIVP
jgi:hypothetical protein